MSDEDKTEIISRIECARDCLTLSRQASRDWGDSEEAVDKEARKDTLDYLLRARWHIDRALQLDGLK